MLLGAPLLAQLNDGKPDPDYAVPERLDLEYSLAFAIDNNFTIRQAKERIRQQEGVVLEVRAAEIPAVHQLTSTVGTSTFRPQSKT